MRKALTAMIAVIAATGAWVAVGSFADAGPGNVKVTICHRTDSHTNPYVALTVSEEAVEGGLPDGRGRGDHYLEHAGPVGPIDEGEWGDIIPPIPGSHDGMNWNPETQAFLAAGCVVPTATTTTTTPPG